MAIKLKAAALIRHRGKVILIRERHNPLKPHRLNIVKGTFEPEKDSTIQAAAIREAKEEAGAKIKLKHLLGISHLRYEGDDIITFTFVADLVGTKFGVAAVEQQATFGSPESIADVKLYTRKELASFKPKDFVGVRAYQAVQDYLKGKKFSLDALKNVK